MESKRVLYQDATTTRPQVLGDIDRTFGEKGVWTRDGGTEYDNPPAGQQQAAGPSAAPRQQPAPQELAGPSGEHVQINNR